MSKEIWLLIKSGGSYEDSYSYPICAYEDKSDAECEMEKLNKELQDMHDNYDALVELSDKYHELHCVGCTKEDCHECEYDVVLPYDIDEQNPYSIERLELITDGE